VDGTNRIGYYGVRKFDRAEDHYFAKTLDEAIDHYVKYEDDEDKANSLNVSILEYLLLREYHTNFSSKEEILEHMHEATKVLPQDVTSSDETYLNALYMLDKCSPCK
jgi:triphosphoribosyl-dephospho-CoA synthetase